MSVWLAIPSKRPPEEAEPILKLWRERGYKIALLVDWNPPGQPLYSRIVKGDLMMVAGGRFAPPGETYPGYSVSCNRLIKRIIEGGTQAEKDAVADGRIPGGIPYLDGDPNAQWFVTGGDDTEPDPNHSAEEIAWECSEYFAKLHAGADAAPGVPLSVKSIDAASRGISRKTFGVMQPTGDRFAQGSIDRIAGSPWIGREFAKRMYGGNGPYWHEYRHMFLDEELMCVAQKLGVFWQRPDLIHLHHHFQRASTAIDANAVNRPVPEFLVEANSPEHWEKYKAIFEDRKDKGFPGHEPL